MPILAAEVAPAAGETEDPEKAGPQKKKKGVTRRRGDPAADRGGGGSWQSWKWDDDD